MIFALTVQSAEQVSSSHSGNGSQRKTAVVMEGSTNMNELMEPECIVYCNKPAQGQEQWL